MLTAVVEVGDEEVHLVSIQSKHAKGIVCFWCWSAPVALYAVRLHRLNKRCLALMLDLDKTVVFSNTLETFESHVDKIMYGLDDN